MKRKIALVLILVMVLSLAACGKENRYTSSNIAKTDGEQIDFSSYVTPVSTAAPVITPEVIPTPEPTPTPTPVPTPTPTPVPSTVILNSGYVTITKSPTSETVDAGGSASFLAYANNFTAIQWIIASPDSQTIYDANTAPKYISGLEVNGQGSSLLKLSNIPADMNGWKVQAIFSGNGGPAYTNVAYVYVRYTNPEEVAARNLAKTFRDTIAAEAAARGFTTSEVSDFSYFSSLGDFTLTFSKGEWKVYGDFIVDPANTSCIALGDTVYYGNQNMTDTYPLTEQTLPAFYALLGQLA